MLLFATCVVTFSNALFSKTRMSLAIIQIGIILQNHCKYEEDDALYICNSVQVKSNLKQRLVDHFTEKTL